MANVQNDTGFKTFPVGTGGATAYCRAKLDSGDAVLAGAGEDSIGVFMETVAADGYATVKLWSAPGTFRMTSAGAIVNGAAVYGAANGQIDDTVAGEKIGTALEAATGANEDIEVLPATAATLLAVQSLISDPTIAASLTQESVTDSSGGSASTTLAAVTNTTNLTDNGGGTADGTVAAQAAPVTITDSTGLDGTHDDTLAAATAPTAPTITYSSNDPSIVPDAAVTVSDGSAPSVAELLEFCEELKKCVADTATAVGVLAQNNSDLGQKLIELVTLADTSQDNLKEVTTELATQRTANGVLTNAVASIAAQLAKIKTDVAAVRTATTNNRTAIASIIDALQANGIVATT
jgi:hypothetical protein